MNRRLSTVDIQKLKGQTPIVCLTAYDFVTAALLDQAGCDIILIGDSLGNVVLGYETTLSVTMSDILRASAAVARGAKRALLVADMPFLSYQSDTKLAIENAGALMRDGGVQAVKLEGGRRNAALIEEMVSIGIPVMGHIGMLPQSVNTVGGYKRYGKSAEELEILLNEARALQKAGVFSIVLECVEAGGAAQITRELKIPTIGIGSGIQCDGQVLVINDLLGYSVTPPPAFVKPAIQMANLVRETVINYIQQVKGSHARD